MNKRFTLCAFMLMVALLLPTSLSRAGTVLVVELKNGSTDGFALQQKPELSMNGHLLVVKTADVELSYVRSEIEGFYFTDSGTGIEEKAKPQLTITQTAADRFAIAGLDAADRIQVGSLTGLSADRAVSRSAGSAVVDLGAFPSGMYIIKIGNKQTIKITKK